MGSIEKGQLRAPSQAVRLQGLPLRAVPFPPVDAFLLCMRQVFFSFSLRHMTPKSSDCGTTWDGVWKLGSSSYSDENLNILH